MEFDHGKIKTLLSELQSTAEDAEQAADEAQSQAEDVGQYARDSSLKAGYLRSSAEELQTALSDGPLAELLTAREKVHELEELREDAAETLKDVIRGLGFKLVDPAAVETMKQKALARQEADAARISELEQDKARLERQLETLKGLIKVEPQPENCNAEDAEAEESATAAA